ncbi:MAG: hypothetical protein E7666_03420 [Ruminococcaceae bacterium]|nr:hypothetical protein [Oscillospiraceae bacterium]
MKKKITKLSCLRILLCVLILLNMTVIFFFSEQSGEESDKTSAGVTQAVAQVTVKDFESKPPSEQQSIIEKLHPYIRKLAHMAEFGSLATLTFLLLLTWKGAILPRFAISQAFTFLYACSDELHQMLSDQRGPQFTDVLIDMIGALLCASILLGVVLLYRKCSKGRSCRIMKTTHYTIAAPQGIDLRIALVSDLHGKYPPSLMQALRAEQPDLILIPGDLMEDDQLLDENAAGFAFLRDCVALAPTFYSLGNHEIGCYHSHHPTRMHRPKPLPTAVRKRIADTGAVLLDNTCVDHGTLCICGLTSGLNGKESRPDAKALKRFSSAGGFRILLCHHPEYFVPYIQGTDIELTVSGHAHGGQWRIFGRGVYAPGQGLFPKYTAGVIDGRCVISRGIGNHTLIPRIFNAPELVMIHCGSTAPTVQTKKARKTTKTKKQK